MVRVNGKKFKIYELDNLITFKNRLASSMKTIERYLYFTNGVTNEDLRNKKSKIVVDDLLAEIKQSAKDNSSVVDLVNNIHSKVGKNKFGKGKEIVKLWLSYNKKLKKDVERQGKFPLDIVGEALYKAKIYITSREIHTAWKESDRVRRILRDDIQHNIDRVKHTLQLFQEYALIDESAAYTEFQVENIQFILTLDLTDISLLELFNTIQLNRSVPFATTNNFYKILQDFIPPDEWTGSDNESVILQVARKNFISISSNKDNYGTATMKVEPESKNITTQIDINTAKDNVSRDIFTDRTLSIFKHLDINVKKVEESSVNGVFFMPFLRLNKYVFADLVMNDEIFSRLINIDDHDKATKKKAGIYIHFDHPTTGYITATLTEKIMIKGDQTMKGADPDFFEPGEPFIRVKVSKANNTKSVEIFQEFLGKLFKLYDEKKNDIIRYYRQYIPNFGDVEVIVEEKKTNVKQSDIAPDLFVTMYSRNCKAGRMPTIVSEEEAMTVQANNQSVMKFPRDIPEDPDAFRFPMDGEGQHYYVCNNPGFRFVGIKENKLSNAELYPYVPCCFKRDQTNKPQYLHYFSGQELVKSEKKQHNIISTNKILKYNQFGTLPSNIESLFTIIDPDPKFEYVRKGVYFNKNSFINSVMEALNDETEILDIQGEDGITEVLQEERIALAQKSIVPLCRQELYDLNIDEILSLIKDPEVYFDPKLFIHLLEDRFDCNIFLFSRKTLDGEMSLPRHLQAYYKNRSTKRCIYVYEHMGSESDHAKHPQCELIVRYNTRKRQENVQYSFTYKEARNVRNVYARMRKSYALDRSIKETFMPLDPSIKVKSQWIDSYGKTRRLNIKYKGEKATLITSPIQPIKVKENVSTTIHLVSSDIAIRLINTLNIQVTNQTTIGGVVKEINGTLGNVEVSIPVKDSNIIDGIPEKQHGLSFPEENVSSLSIYNTNKKLARYLSEYVLWVYSNFLYENGIIDISDDNIAQFGKTFFTIKPDHKYEHVEKTFRKDSHLLEDGKIIVPSYETIKRLIYVLRLSAQRNADAIRNYHNRDVMNNYYVDITDFDKYHGQVILFGEESVEKWIMENNIVYIIRNDVQIGVQKPYFFRNNLIDNNVYLAQNTQTLEKAIYIAVTWIRDGNNPGIYAEEMEPVEFTLYSYHNVNRIDKIFIKGKPFSEEIKILGYKIDNTPEYTVLLSLA